MNPRLLAIIVILIPAAIFSQDNQGRLSGNFQLDAQTYRADSSIGAVEVPERILANSYANFRYDQGGFSAGIRFEGYMNTLQGFDPGYDGVGFPHIFAQYRHDELDITVGNYYEQFGSGILLRTWEDKNLGVDNSLFGVRLRYHFTHGLSLTGLIGQQRIFFDMGPGLVSAIDGNLEINELISSLAESSTRISLGGSFVSKYQPDEDPIYILPENVAGWASRLNLSRGGFRIESEYAFKINDPSADNGFIFKPGEALLINAGYAGNGIGVSLSAKRVDNMSFRSCRDQNLTKLMINYLPPISKNHTYSLMSYYPYASQPTGEAGLMGELSYRLKRETMLGGKYGTQIVINVSLVNDISRQQLNDTIPIGKPGTLGYSSDFLSIGDEVFYRDFNLEISRKLNKNWKLIAVFQHLLYNQMIIEGKGGMVKADIGLIDLTWKIAPRHALRFEAQGMWTEDDKGNWAMLLAEYSVSPNWFFSVSDQYNYGNPDESKRNHYLYCSLGYVRDANRIQLSYGKQREGILCVGGVCRNVPAMNGFTISLTSSF
jgi:hypothetical protein